MIKIEKKYHFHAAHRNMISGEKCARIHGHTYNVLLTFQFSEFKENGITLLFSEIDKRVEPIIKEFDHYFLIYQDDPFIQALQLHDEPHKELPFETSAENLAIWIFNRVKNETKLPVIKITLAETKSSTIEYEESITSK